MKPKLEPMRTAKSFIRRFTAMASLASLCAAGATAHAGPNDLPPDISEARKQLFAEAIAAMEAKDWAKCRVRALGVWAERKNWQVGGLLGICEEKLGMNAEAGEHLAAYRQGDDKKNAARTADVEAAWQRARAKIGVIEVKANVENVTLNVNGAGAGTAPVTLYLAPGNVSIEAKREGYKTRTEQVVVKASKDQAVALVLEPDGGGPTQPTPGGRPVWPAGLLGGVAAVGLGLGIGFTVVSVGRAGDADDMAAGCTTWTAACESDVNDLLDESDTFMGVGIGGFALGGAAAIGMIVYLAMPDAANDTARFTPVLGPTDVGASFSLRFQ